MLNLDPAKLLVIFVVALIVLGPERLPTVARQLGGAWRELNRLRERFDDQVRSVIPLEDIPHMPRPTSAVAEFLGSSRPGAVATGDQVVEEVAPLARAQAAVSPSVQASSGIVALTASALIARGDGEFAVLSHDPSLN